MPIGTNITALQLRVIKTTRLPQKQENDFLLELLKFVGVQVIGILLAKFTAGLSLKFSLSAGLSNLTSQLIASSVRVVTDFTINQVYDIYKEQSNTISTLLNLTPAIGEISKISRAYKTTKFFNLAKENKIINHLGITTANNLEQVMYQVFSKTIKHFITQKWDLIDKNDFYFDLGFILFKQIFPGFHLRLIPTFRYFHFDNYSLRSKKTYLEGIFYRLRSRDFYTRFPQIETINIREKNKITNTYYLQTLRLVKWLYYQMSMKNNHLANSHFNIPLNKYYLFDYLLYPVYYKYFLKDNPLQRCFDVIREVLQRIIIKYDSIYLPNNLIAFWELEIDNEELQYTLEHLLEYINEHYSEEHAYEEIYEEVQNFVEYMESLEPKEKKH